MLLEGKGGDAVFRRRFSAGVQRQALQGERTSFFRLQYALVRMKQKDVLGILREEWAGYLRERGQPLSRPRGINCVLASRNSGGKHYRWLLLTARGKSRSLSRAEQEDVALNLKRADRLGEDAFVVVKFEKPVCKVVILPAETVLKKGRILSRKGGIPWDG